MPKRSPAPESLRLDRLHWTTAPQDAAALRRQGWNIVEFHDLRTRFIEPARTVGLIRESLDNPAKDLLRLFDRGPLAVLNVPVETLGDLRDMYGYLVEPAYRRQVGLLIHASRDLNELEADELEDPEFGYAWTLQRLQFVDRRFRLLPARDGRPPMTPIEHILLSAMEAVGLTPHPQFGIDRYRADFAFPAHRLIVECDGRHWHNPQRDAQRDAHLARLGWETLRFSGSRIVHDSAGVAADIKTRIDELSQQLIYTDLPQPDTAPPPRRRWWRRILDRFRRRPTPVEPAHEELDTAPPTTGGTELDEAQWAAVSAPDGVVQVLAPAGSGKTKAIVSRVETLISRGVPANRILCTTFNRRARGELTGRLSAGLIPLGPNGVTVLSFHALGRRILDEEGLLRAELSGFSFAQWGWLASLSGKVPGGANLDAQQLQELISTFKLDWMASPDEALQRAKTAEERTAAQLYSRYEEQLETQNSRDFDDLILLPLRLMRSNPEVRRKWQRRFEAVLVDEYQDIEPAQELLVQMLAAPHDSLFCVGDEDQCIYTWRRADISRIVELDRRYRSLDRVVLRRSYRCPTRIVEAAGRLIAHNRKRFPKPIEAGNPRTGVITVTGLESTAAAAERVAKLLEHAEPTTTVLVARTTNLLRAVAIACARRGVAFNASDKVVAPGGGARAALLAYLRLLTRPTAATEQDVRLAFRTPNRYLPDGGARSVANLLGEGATFTEGVVSLGVTGWRAQSMIDGAALLDELCQMTDAGEIIHELRSRGGLDVYYSAREMVSPQDESDIDVLVTAEREAAGMAPDGYVARLEEEDQLLDLSRDERGVELTTIHGAKGREWDTVFLFGADEGQLPHVHHSDAPDSTADAVDVEEERRLMYVAMTRSKNQLHIVHTRDQASRFVTEAGLGDADPLPM